MRSSGRELARSKATCSTGEYSRRPWPVPSEGSRCAEGAAASADIARYLALRPAGLIYDKSAKRYTAGDDFRPVLATPDANRLLAELRVAEQGLVPVVGTALGRLPPVATTPVPERAVDPFVLGAVLRAIRSAHALSVHYQSMSRPQPIRRTIEPHALAYDGFRWHVRAYCHNRRDFFHRHMHRQRIQSLACRVHKGQGIGHMAEWNRRQGTVARHLILNRLWQQFRHRSRHILRCPVKLELLCTPAHQLEYLIQGVWTAYARMLRLIRIAHTKLQQPGNGWCGRRRQRRWRWMDNPQRDILARSQEGQDPAYPVMRDQRDEIFRLIRRRRRKSELLFLQIHWTVAGKHNHRITIGRLRHTNRYHRLVGGNHRGTIANFGEARAC